MEQFLTAVIGDVDAYWTRVFTEAGLNEPRVRFRWIPPGSTAQSACLDQTGRPTPMSDTAAAYCPADDTIYISEQFASNIYNGALDARLPGSYAGTGERSVISRSRSSSRTSTGTAFRMSSASIRTTPLSFR